MTGHNPKKTKVCSKCSKRRLVKFYSRDKQKKDGLCSSCKDCQAAYRQKPEVKRAKKVYQHRNKEKIAKYQRSREYRERRNSYARSPLGRAVKNAYRRSPQGRAMRKKSRDKYYSGAAGAQKLRAHRAICDAVREGRLVRKSCQVCGGEPGEAHHEDYSKPLDVVWLCSTCHNQYHDTGDKKW